MGLVDLCRPLLQRSVPEPVYDLGRRAARQVRRARRKVLWDMRYDRILREVTRTEGYVVQGGPFAGMRYVTNSQRDEVPPRLLGAYEAELHPVIQEIVRRGYDRVIDIGSAEGYYAVGFAMVMPEAEVFAFDIEPHLQRLCRQMARLNGVESRVIVGGLCDAETLGSLVKGRTLVQVDCEGAEVDILRPDLAPNLADCDILVELHDFIDPRVSRLMRERFSQTHDITIVDSMKHDPRRYPVLASLPERDRLLAVDDRRPVPMQWAMMRARSQPEA